MRAKQVTVAIVGSLMLFLAAPLGYQAVAQEKKSDEPGLSDVLTDLLHGVEGDKATAGPDQRVPFGREEMQLSFAPLVKQTAPAVVNVYASQTAKVRSPFDGDPFFEEFFGRSIPRAQSSLGSGVLVDPTGIIVTNFHVIKDADEVKVAMSDGREFNSKVMLKDETLDLAVLKIDSDKPFPVIAIGDSDALQVGDPVSARPRPAASCPPWRAATSAFRIRAFSSRRMRLSIRAIPAAVSSIWAASWWASTPPSTAAAVVPSALALPSRPTWCAPLSRPRSPGRISSSGLTLALPSSR
jgi:S1-C subfamily serine protease